MLWDLSNDETGEVDDVEMRPEEFKEQFQDMMAELMGGDIVMERWSTPARSSFRAPPELHASCYRACSEERRIRVLPCVMCVWHVYVCLCL